MGVSDAEAEWCVQPVIDVPLSKAYDKTWQAMEMLVDEGKAKLIGEIPYTF